MPGTSPGMTWWVWLLDRQWIHRAPDRAGDRDRGCDEHEHVDLVGRAVVGELLEIEDLAHGHAHDRDGDPVPRLIDAGLGLVGAHLAAPRIRRERGELDPLDPFQCLEREAGRVAARIAVPAARLLAALHLPGAHDHVVAALHRDALLLRGLVEVRAGDAVAVLERVDALVARDVEQHAAADHLVLGLLDAALLRAVARHLAAI